jgi:hypothetical protein
MKIAIIFISSTCTMAYDYISSFLCSSWDGHTYSSIVPKQNEANQIVMWHYLPRWRSAYCSTRHLHCCLPALITSRYSEQQCHDWMPSSFLLNYVINNNIHMTRFDVHTITWRFMEKMIWNIRTPVLYLWTVIMWQSDISICTKSRTARGVWRHSRCCV